MKKVFRTLWNMVIIAKLLHPVLLVYVASAEIAFVLFFFKVLSTMAVVFLSVMSFLMHFNEAWNMEEKSPTF